MSHFNPIPNERIRFELQHVSLGAQDIDMPIGWDEVDGKEYARNNEYDGIFAKFSNNLKFIGNGAVYINTVREVFGIQTTLRLRKYERHPKTDKWTVLYDGYLDMSTWEEEDDAVKVKFNSGGLEELLKARESEQLEINRLTSMDGAVIPPLKTETVKLSGRKIFLKSKWSTYTPPNNPQEEIDLSVFSNDGNTREQSEGFPFTKLVNKSHEEAQAIIFNTQGNANEGSTGMMLLAVMDRERVFKVHADEIKFKVRFTQGVSPAITDYQWCSAKLSFVIYENGTDFNVKERITFWHVGDGSSDYANLPNVQNMSFNVGFSQYITLLEGESLGCEILLAADLKSGSGRRVTMKMTEYSGTVTIDEDSVFDETYAKCILAHETGNRILQIITGKAGVMKSNFFGRQDLGYAADGPGAYTAFTHGFWVRQFDELPISTEDEPNLFKPLTTSWKDWFNSVSSVWNVGLGIERIGHKEQLIIEDKKKFYSRVVTIRLPHQVQNEKRNDSIKDYFSGIEIGYEKGGDYEEAMGLDEPNGKSTFTTLFTVIKNTFSQISAYRGDAIGMEFCRRKQMENYPTDDTSYDSDIWHLDLKRGTNTYFQQRVWQDDFAEKPKFIYSPETATNLRLSPVNMLLRHGWEIGACLLKYPTDYIRYGSSTANSNLQTRLIGGVPRQENGNILNAELGRPRHKAELLEFEHELDFDLLTQIEGYTETVEGKVYNIYGLVEFPSKKGIERGWILNLKPSGKGKWQILLAN